MDFGHVATIQLVVGPSGTCNNSTVAIEMQSVWKKTFRGRSVQLWPKLTLLFDQLLCVYHWVQLGRIQTVGCLRTSECSHLNKQTRSWGIDWLFVSRVYTVKLFGKYQRQRARLGLNSASRTALTISRHDIQGGNRRNIRAVFKLVAGWPHDEYGFRHRGRDRDYHALSPSGWLSSNARATFPTGDMHVIRIGTTKTKCRLTTHLMEAGLSDCKFAQRTL